MQPFPDACALGYCVQAPELPPPGEPLMACCMEDGCYEITGQEIDDCEGKFLSCDWGQTNLDGT
jgi:hypothetical protein